MPTESDKRALRAYYRQRRRALPSEQRQLEQQSIHQHLSRWVSERKLRTIACYRAADGEVELKTWMSEAALSGSRILLPIIGKSPGEMQFGQYQGEARLTPNRFGIAEPESPMANAAEQIDLVLLPLVAFDGHGTRLGMGGGYYDRFLQHNRAIRCGVAFECQRSSDELPREVWDIQLNAVVTGSGMIEFSPRAR